MYKHADEVHLGKRGWFLNGDMISTILLLLFSLSLSENLARTYIRSQFLCQFMTGRGRGRRGSFRCAKFGNTLIDCFVFIALAILIVNTCP